MQKRGQKQEVTIGFGGKQGKVENLQIIFFTEIPEMHYLLVRLKIYFLKLTTFPYMALLIVADPKQFEFRTESGRNN